VITRGKSEIMNLDRWTMEANSSRETARNKPECRKCSTKYLSFGFTDIDVDGEERPRCLRCMKTLAVESMKPNKLKRNDETVHA
jgi:hypothetical protein